MAAITPESADAARDRGLITPDQHAQLTGGNPPPPEWEGGQSESFIPPVNAPPPPQQAPAPMPSVPGGPMANVPAPMGPPSPAPVGPPSVAVGPITAAATPVVHRALDPRLVGMKETERLAGEQAAVAADVGAVKQDRAQALADQQAAEQKRREAEEAQHALDAQKDKAAIDKHIVDTNRAVDDYANSTVNPGRWWSNQSTGNKITAALAVGLGGFAEGFSHGAVKNTALAQINRYIDQDIQAQMTDQQKKKGVIDDRRGVFHDMVAAGQSKEAAYQSARLAGLQNAELQAKALAARFDPKLESDNTKMQLGAISQSINDQRTQLNTTLQKEAQARATAAAHYANERDDKKFEHGVKLAEIQNKKDQVDVERLKATKGSELEQKERIQSAEKQRSIEEANKQLDALKKSPVLDRLGFLAGAAGGTRVSQMMMPESSNTRVKVQAMNLQMVSAASKLLKDSEGRMPPSTIDRIEKLEIHPYDTPEVAREKIEGIRREINSLARQGGSSVAAPDAPTPTLDTTEAPQ